MSKNLIEDRECDILLNAAQSNTKGEIELIWEPGKNAGNYIIQKATGNIKPGNWKYEDIIDKTKYTITQLKSGKIYWFRVAAVKGKSKNLWCRPVKKKAP
jgi:hypothetical protein